MDAPRIMVVQKVDSPLSFLLDKALDWQRVDRSPRWEAPPLPGWLEEEQIMVVWDLAGFQPQEQAALARQISPEKVGVLLLGSGPAHRWLDLARQTRANQLLVDPKKAREINAALSMALSIQQRICLALSQKAELAQLLADRGVIEQAKMVLVAHLGLGEQEAMRRMQKHSRNTNQKLVQVARFILSTQPMLTRPGA